MQYCHKCEMEFEAEDGCLCAVYRELMRRGHYNSVPPQWITDWWEDKLYCDTCRSSYWPGGICDCGFVRGRVVA